MTDKKKYYLACLLVLGFKVPVNNFTVISTAGPRTIYTTQNLISNNVLFSIQLSVNHSEFDPNFMTMPRSKNLGLILQSKKTVNLC